MDMLPPANASELVTRDYFHREMAERTAELRAELGEKTTQVTKLIAEQTRTIMIAMLTLWVSGIALAFMVARLAG